MPLFARQAKIDAAPYPERHPQVSERFSLVMMKPIVARGILSAGGINHARSFPPTSSGREVFPKEPEWTENPGTPISTSTGLQRRF
jgi:hypothetical protein